MCALETTVLNDFVSKYVEAKLRTDGAMSKQQRLRTSGMCMFSNVGLREATEQQRKLAEGILGLVGVLIKGGYILNGMLEETVKGRYLRAFVAEGAVEAEAAYLNMCNKRKLKGGMLKEELRYVLTTNIGLEKALCKFEGRSHTPDEYMEDLKSAADVACTVRNGIVDMAARGNGNWAVMETMAKAVDNAAIASCHSRLFPGVNEVHWLLRESDVVVKQTLTKVLKEVKAMSAACGVAAERLGIFFDRANEEDVVVIKADEVQEKEQKKHIGEMIKFFCDSAATLCYAAWTLVGDPDHGKEGGVNSNFPGQMQRSVFFFEGEEVKKRNVMIQPLRV